MFGKKFLRILSLSLFAVSSIWLQSGCGGANGGGGGGTDSPAIEDSTTDPANDSTMSDPAAPGAAEPAGDEPAPAGDDAAPAE